MFEFMPPECKICDRLRNCINGGFCVQLNKYVEYAKERLCDEDSKGVRGGQAR